MQRNNDDLVSSQDLFKNYDFFDLEGSSLNGSLANIDESSECLISTNEVDDTINLDNNLESINYFDVSSNSNTDFLNDNSGQLPNFNQQYDAHLTWNINSNNYSVPYIDPVQNNFLYPNYSNNISLNDFNQNFFYINNNVNNYLLNKDTILSNYMKQDTNNSNNQAQYSQNNPIGNHDEVTVNNTQNIKPKRAKQIFKDQLNKETFSTLEEDAQIDDLTKKYHAARHGKDEAKIIYKELMKIKNKISVRKYKDKKKKNLIALNSALKDNEINTGLQQIMPVSQYGLFGRNNSMVSSQQPNVDLTQTNINIISTNMNNKF